MGVVSTLGDSTLDTIYWQKQANDCVELQLRDLLNRNSSQPYEVISHAYDGFTTESVLNGDVVGRVLPRGYTLQSYLTHKKIAINDLKHRVEPLRDVKASVEAQPTKNHFVVLSVGGNDFRERLANPFSMVSAIGTVQKNYLEILNRLEQIKGVKPIIMTQYLVDANNDCYGVYLAMKVLGCAGLALQGLTTLGLAVTLRRLIVRKPATATGVVLALSMIGGWLSTKILPFKATFGILRGQKIGMTVLGCFIEKFYRPILEKAVEKQIPILDLTNSFNPYESLYVSQIEPNAEGGQRIAKGIARIVQKHDFTGKSRLYVTHLDDSIATKAKQWRVFIRKPPG